MKTPSITLPQASTHQLKFHDTSGRSRTLDVQGDGKVEASLLQALPKESFLSSLDDARLLGADPFTDLARSGWHQDYGAGYQSGGFTMYLDGSDGARQQVAVRDNADGGRLASLFSTAGGVEHRLAGESREGKLVAESVKESLVIDASPAGLPVYQDGAILFDLPSVFTGGCTI